MGLRDRWTMLYKEKSRAIQDMATTQDQRGRKRGREEERAARKTLAR